MIELTTRAGRDKLGHAPIQAGGTTYWLTHHAAERALEMGIPLTWMPGIIRNGTWHAAPETSKYQDCHVLRNGAVSLGLKRNGRDWAITTVLWATAEAWRNAPETKGRQRRDTDETIAALEAWLKS